MASIGVRVLHDALGARTKKNDTHVDFSLSRASQEINPPLPSPPEKLKHGKSINW